MYFSSAKDQTPVAGLSLIGGDLRSRRDQELKTSELS